MESIHLKYLTNHLNIQTHDQLKKKLYRDIIQLFDEGDVNQSYSFHSFLIEIFLQAWEKAIEVCKDLQIQYEQSFEYDHLSSLLVGENRLNIFHSHGFV